MSDLLVVFVIGLLSSVHCVGMCGGLVLALSGVQNRTGRPQLRQAVYFLGKTTTYTVLGALAGAFGAAVSTVFSGAQNIVSIGLGIVLVLTGLSLAGWLKRIRLPNRLIGSNFFSRTLAGLLNHQSYRATFGLGALNGFLPCALVYAMLVKAASTGSTLDGALTMAVFGLATVPALSLVGVTAALMRSTWRARLSYAGSVLVILLGLLTILRGTTAGNALMHSTHIGSSHTYQQPANESMDGSPASHATHSH